MQNDDKEEFVQILKEYDEMHFCFVIILYYHRNVKSLVNIDQLIEKEPSNLINNLPSEITKVLEIYNFFTKVKSLKEGDLKNFFKQKNDYIIENIKTPFSLCKALFLRFNNLCVEHNEIFQDMCSVLNLIWINNMKNLLYVGEQFNELLLSEILFAVVQIKDFKEIHILNYCENSIDVKKCLESTKELFFVEQDLIDLMFDRISIVEKVQLSFEYLEKYIVQSSNDNFIFVIGIERFIDCGNNSEIDINFIDSKFSLSTNENIDWNAFVEKINNLYSLIIENNTYLTIAYMEDNPFDDASNKINLYYNDSMFFSVLFDLTKTPFYNDKENKKLLDDIINKIITDNNAYQSILESESKITKANFLILKTYYYLNNNDYFSAITELEQMQENNDFYFKFLLAELYNNTDKTKESYTILKEIYEKDKFFPNLVNAILFSLRYSDNKEEKLMWIERGLAINQNDPTMVNHLANYYTIEKDYLNSAQIWKQLYDLTNDIFYIILYEINLLLISVDKTQMNNILKWVEQKIYTYPEYSNEIYSRIGCIVFEKISKEKSLQFFEKIEESFDNSNYDSSNKKMRIYFDKLSRGASRTVNKSEMKNFIFKLIDNVVILTYGEQSVYSWSSFIYKSFSYDTWVELLNQILVDYLVKSVKIYDEGGANETKLDVKVEKILDFNGLYENYNDSLIPNLEKLNKDEYLLILLGQAKIRIAEGEIQLANDISYTFYKLANSFEDDFHKSIAMSFGLLIWSNTNMAIGAYAESILSFAAATNRFIKIGESIYLHEFILDQFLYLYNSSTKIELNDMDFITLKKYFSKLGYPQEILYSIVNKYEYILENENPALKTIISQCEEANIYFVAKKQIFENMIYFDSLITAYYKVGKIDEARIYLKRLYPNIKIMLEEYMQTAHHFLLKYSDVYLSTNDYDSAIELLKESQSIIEKLRRISFSSERSYLGYTVEELNRRIIFSVCKKHIEKDDLNFDDLLIKTIINLVPKSIIEERNSNCEIVFDEEILIKEKRYYQLFHILGNMKNKSIDNFMYKRTADEFFEIKNYLEKCHPNFKPLSQYYLIGCRDMNPFNFIGNKLKQGEVFYRNILIEEYIVHILISKNSYTINSEKINLKELNELLEQLEYMIDEHVENIEKIDIIKYESLFNSLSKILFQPLIDQINSFNSLYYMPDYKLLHITPNFIRSENKWLIECIDRIELVIDYNNIGNSKNNIKSALNKFFVSGSTKGGLHEIKKTIDEFSHFSQIDISETGHIIIKEPINTLIVAAHGISEEYGESYYGAKKIELSRKKQIILNEFITIYNSSVENAIIIACSGGTPTNNKIERNNGVWDSMLRKNVKYILYCKWDVSTMHTNDLLVTILQEMKTNNKLLSEALIIAQRELMHLNPILWAGLEVWKNH